jgi:type IV secretion system protein VirB11
MYTGQNSFDLDQANAPFDEYLATLDPISKKALGPFRKYFNIPNLKEIVVNQPEEIGLEMGDGSWEFREDKHLTESLLYDVARVLANRVGQIFVNTKPVLSCKMPGGHRVQIVAGFATPKRFSMTIRLQRRINFPLEAFDMLPEERTAVCEAAKNKKTILISGGTGTGKTSFMNALIPFIPMDERLITLEDVPELKVPHRNWVPLLFSGNETGIGTLDISELLNSTLRMRPDRIIMGEIRKENAFTFCSAINTGHDGSMATIHANSPKTALDAVINRAIMNGEMLESTIGVMRRQLHHDIYGVVQLTRIRKGVKATFHVLPKEKEE